MNSEDIEILTIFQTVPHVLDGTVCIQPVDGSACIGNKSIHSTVAVETGFHKLEFSIIDVY